MGDTGVSERMDDDGDQQPLDSVCRGSTLRGEG